MNKLVRFDPFAEMDALQRRFFNDDGWMPRQMRSVGLPTTDVYLKDNTLVVEAHLPNFHEDDVNISVEHGNLVIQAERHEKEEDKDKKYVVRDSIEAHLDDGILKVTIPVTPAPEPKKIAVKSHSKKK